MKNVRKGFTTIELLIVIFIVSNMFMWLLVIPVIKNNICFTEKGVLKEIQMDHPEAKKVIRTKRNFLGYSQITTEQGDGTRDNYDLDTNIFFSYEIHPAE